MLVDKNIVKSSFFDSQEDFHGKKGNQVRSQFWLSKKDFQIEYNQNYDQFQKGPILHQDIMCKQDENSQIIECYFLLFDKFLVQCESPEAKQNIVAILPLKFLKVEYQESIEAEEDELPFFLFSRNKQFDILVPESNQAFKIWLELFRTRCIMTYFAKQYKNIRVIGKGTFARVLLCKRNQDNMQFAVKTYDKKKIEASDNSKLTIMGIQNEIEIMLKLNHKNIIHLHEIYEGEYHIYLVLDLLTGGELFNKLQTKDSYSERDAFFLIKNLLQSLDHMHQQGIMHRDIKPENLILKNEESETEIMLADFGLSEACNKENLLFKRCGTPGYVAPEILNNQPYNTQVDIFSAGIILYIMLILFQKNVHLIRLTGYSPFFGDNYQEILDKNKKCNICFDFKKININLSKEAIDLLKSLLQANPKTRCTAAQALAHPWMKKYENEQQKSDNLTQLNAKNSQKMIKDLKLKLKLTKPEKKTDSNQIIMNSPLITGNANEINSPNSPFLDSPQFTFIEKTQPKKRSSAFAQQHQQALQKTLEEQGYTKSDANQQVSTKKK